MLERAQVQLIDDLHRLGRQLAVLKRIYQSYDLIVNRVLKRQRLLREEVRNSQPGNMHHPHPHQQQQRGSHFGLDFLSRGDTWKANVFDEMNPNELGGIQLSSAAVGRFERLLDRIRLYALSEIDECLAEKESMTFMVCLSSSSSSSAPHLEEASLLIQAFLIIFKNFLGIQFNRRQRFAGSRAADSNYNSHSQGNHFIPASYPDDWVFFNGD